MASHVFSAIFIHANWHCLADRPLLTPEVEAVAHKHIRQRCLSTKGIYLEGVGGTQTHVHIAYRMEPHINISKFLGELKGFSSFETNKESGRKLLSWQRGFGALSFGKRQLTWVLDYIRRQKEHHARGTVHPRLEAADAEEGEAG